MDKKNLISIVIPVFNEELVIQELYNSLTSVMQKLDYAYEIIFIDDGSIDSSFNILCDLHNKDNNIKIIKFSRNFGQQNAYVAGIAHVSGSAAILIDADLEDPPELLPKMIKHWEEGNKVVYTIKASRKEGFIGRMLFNLFYKILSLMVGRSLPYGAGIFSLIDKEVVNLLNSMPEKNKYLSGLRAYVGFKQIGIKFESHQRFAGRPRQTFGKHLKLALDAVFSFSYLPLRVITYFGLCIAASGFIAAILLAIFRITKGPIVPGWTSIICVVLVLSGVQLVSLGVIGEYLGRVFDDIKNRPEYIIENKIGF